MTQEHQPEVETYLSKDLNNFVLYLPGSEQRDQMAELGMLTMPIDEPNASPKKLAMTYGEWLDTIDKAIVDAGIPMESVRAAVLTYLHQRTNEAFELLTGLIRPVIEKLRADGFSEFDVKG